MGCAVKYFLVRPKWIHEPVDTSISRGEEARLDCSGEGVPSPSISWYKSTGIMETHKFFRVNCINTLSVVVGRLSRFLDEDIVKVWNVRPTLPTTQY